MNIVDEIKSHNVVTFINQNFINNVIKNSAFSCIQKIKLNKLKKKFMEAQI